MPEMTPEMVAKSRPVKPLSLTMMSRKPAPETVRATPEAMEVMVRLRLISVWVL